MKEKPENLIVPRMKVSQFSIPNFCMKLERLGNVDILPQTVSVRVDLKLHRDRDVISSLDHLERRRGLDNLSSLFVSGLVLGSLDSSAGVPTELIPEWVIGLLGDRQPTTVALVADDLEALSLGLILDLHGAHDIDAGVETAFVEENESLFLGLFMQLFHVGRNVARGGQVAAYLKTGIEHWEVHSGRHKGDHIVVSGYQSVEIFLL